MPTEAEASIGPSTVSSPTRQPGRHAEKPSAERFNKFPVEHLRWARCAICCHLRVDVRQAAIGERFKTVDLIVAEWAWEPPAPRIPADQIVALRIGFAEVALRERVKQAGGKWNPRRKVWELCYGHVISLNLEARIVEYEATTYRDED